MFQVLMTFLVGNDFIPSLPFFSTETLPKIHTIYTAVLPQLGGYINENGVLNLERLGLLMKALSVIDENNFMFQRGMQKSNAIVNYQAEFQSFKEMNSRYYLWMERDVR